MGYFAWSLMDDFESSSGYSIRYGLWFVDRNNNLKRLTKSSVDWYRSFLAMNSSQLNIYDSANDIVEAKGSI
ncbi:hypothetical protein AQUCO_01100257v1 [Aquilegia coerulea]|uniref:Beta-glucosidase n=1 Tax=Aquilegia coerulea TaxID=218851 RepID=A0A2G5E698_AQUCA|nr:hypothetical protein AQUCO_01100257v1 [Aquilegia coerulea]